MNLSWALNPGSASAVQGGRILNDPKAILITKEDKDPRQRSFPAQRIPQRVRSATWERAVHAGVVAAREPTASTHLRLQQADLLHLLQRQQRVADRVLEQHVQQHLEREVGASASVRPPRLPDPTPTAGPRSGQGSGPNPGLNPGPNRGLRRARTPQPLLTMAPAPSPARNAARGLWRAEPGSGSPAPDPRWPIRGRGRYLFGLPEGSTAWYLPAGSGGGASAGGRPFPASAAARAAQYLGTRGPGPSLAGCRTVWKSAFLDNSPGPHVLIR